MANKSILIVEDNPTHQRILAVLAEQAGITPFVLANGRDALDALQSSSQFALVLMDRRLGDMDGLECTREIRERERSSGQHIPIIAVTAHAMLGDREKCLDAGMDDYLSKPFTARQIHQLLNRWVAAGAHHPLNATRHSSRQAGANDCVGPTAPLDPASRPGT
ncbi:MAG TPA: response regulator [Candidatus Obscuribacterales bacterium]